MAKEILKDRSDETLGQKGQKPRSDSGSVHKKAGSQTDRRPHGTRQTPSTGHFKSEKIQ